MELEKVDFVAPANEQNRPVGGVDGSKFELDFDGIVPRCRYQEFDQ